MPHSKDRPSKAKAQDSEWLSTARNLLESLSTAELGIEATLGCSEISAADSPAIDFLAEQVEAGFAWIEETHATAHTEVSTELLAALGVLRNLAFAVRRLTTGEQNNALRGSCDALIEQSRLHVQAARRAIHDAVASL